jgi:hypothetical protein
MGLFTWRKRDEEERKTREDAFQARVKDLL